MSGVDGHLGEQDTSGVDGRLARKEAQLAQLQATIQVLLADSSSEESDSNVTVLPPRVHGDARDDAALRRGRRGRGKRGHGRDRGRGRARAAARA